jgi:hypothetical protein
MGHLRSTFLISLHRSARVVISLMKPYFTSISTYAPSRIASLTVPVAWMRRVAPLQERYG